MARIAVVRKDRCNSQGCGGFLCAKLCPINRTGKECIIKGADNKPVIDEVLCTGCGICQNRCPFEAISIINLPQELSRAPIHRYGANGFALYSLPMPLFGRVVGVLGRNGIGKSTAVKILAQVLAANLGREKAEIDELIAMFRGTEMQVFLEKVRKGEIKVAYKPQNIDAGRAQGIVGELLRKVDEKGELASVADKLNIGGILKSDVQSLSGGEMQRVAIAATVLKKANVYIFDEPTSYLDIKQRLIVSRFIKGLADADTAVVAIEHDLVALDYMADIVHIMYGREGAYGIVSLQKNARAGINAYLDGFLREENVRFRGEKIRFEVQAPEKRKAGPPLFSWPAFGKSLGRFTLHAEPGSISGHETVGVLGENATGKTTFVKILAGALSPDGSSLKTSVSVSYKPQYLKAADTLAAEYLAGTVEKYQTDLVRPLGLGPLLTKKLSELSGGELQRVEIAKALSQERQLVLLDEPSAYLDVEQRLMISRVIKNFAYSRGFSVLVVDHDLVFLDYLSERLMVFSGTPGISGTASGPHAMDEGMNRLLSEVSITLRREKETKRPRINKPGSIKDEEQKKSGKYYYA